MLKKDKSKWCWVDDDRAGYPYDTRIEAIEDFYSDDRNAEVTEVHIGHPEYFVPEIDVENIIEQLQYDATDEFYGIGELADDYLSNVKDEHKKELEIKLNAVIQKWERRHGYNLTTYAAAGIEKFHRVKLERLK